MNELRRMAYLDALGIDSYVSRTQLPGAAVTRRLAIVPVPVRLPAADVRVDIPDLSKAVAVPVVAPAGISAGSPLPREMLARPSAQPVPPFSLTTIVAGDWLWLEELGGMPLTTEQVQLVQSMALALVRAMDGDNAASAEGKPAAKPDVAQFDWPLHTNRQLDLGEDAARASVLAFVSRRLEQYRCRGLILLGQRCVMRVPLPQIKVPVVSTASSAEILANPRLKRQVWRDLQPLLGNT